MVDSSFLAIFKDELAEHLKQITDLVLELENAPPDRIAGGDLLEALMREFHTIKGAARAIQFDAIKETAHQVEDVYHALMEGRVEVRLPALADLSLAAADRIEGLFEAELVGAVYGDRQDLSAAIADYLAGKPTTLPPRTVRAETPAAAVGDPPVVPAVEKSETPPAEAAPACPPAAEPEPSAPPPTEEVRMPAAKDVGPAGASVVRAAPDDYNALTDALLNLSGEMSVAVSPLEDQRARLRDLATDVARLGRELGTALGDLVEQVHEAGRVPPMDRLREIQERLHRLHGKQTQAIEAFDFAENRLRRLTDEFGDRVTRARLLPLSTLFAGYPRVVRDLTRELGKQCRVRISGETMRVDRAVLEALRAPLLQLIRNALAHGIETPDERVRAGKDPEGTIEIGATQMAGMIRICVSDDGSGIDMGRVRDRVIAGGHISGTLWNAMDNHEREQFLFLPGFTTSEKVSETSGRGFGLDIVKTVLERIGGRVEVAGGLERGAGFVLEVPQNLSLTRCLMVAGGRHGFFGVQHLAFPMHDIGEVRRITQSDLRMIDGRRAVRVGEQTLLLAELSTLVGLEPLHDDLERKHLLVVGSGGRQYGLLVDEVIGEQDNVSHTFDERIAKVRDMQASTLLRDGGVALIVDMKDLLQSIAESRAPVGRRLGQSDDAAMTVAEERPSILVVEDSATVREVERHFLEAAGFDVTTAINGIDGLNKLRDSNFSLVITDIDMPRMNGIELIRKLRIHERYGEIPIIVVSYKDREKDQAEVLAAGADHFVTKSAFDSGDMLEMIRGIVGGHA